MARAVETDADLDDGEVVVEKKIIPARSRTSPFAIIVLIAFAITCAVVFFGGNIRTPAENTAAPVPPAQTTTP
jgi:hypothetical protein